MSEIGYSDIVSWFAFMMTSLPPFTFNIIQWAAAGPSVPHASPCRLDAPVKINASDLQGLAQSPKAWTVEP